MFNYHQILIVNEIPKIMLTDFDIREITDNVHFGYRFSYSAVHFALCHIYSGANNIPDSINIVELATLTDMLCLEGLKDVIMYTLKVKYCHFFHKVC